MDGRRGTEVLEGDDITILVTGAGNIGRSPFDPLTGELGFAYQSKSFAALTPVFRAATIDVFNLALSHGHVSFVSDARRPHRRREGSRIASRPPEAANGGTDLGEPSQTAAANWRCRNVLDAGAAGTELRGREKKRPAPVARPCAGGTGLRKEGVTAGGDRLRAP